MATSVSAIRPGLLVALKSTVRGGVSYSRVDLETGEDIARWETTKRVQDPDEHARAVKARGKALAEIRGVCVPTSFGLLCPESRESDLDSAIVRAFAARDAHNQGAQCTTVDVYVLKGRIASTDEQASRAISSELRGLMADMETGITQLDAGAIREAALKAKNIAAMLSEEKAQAVTEAVAQARLAARAIVKRVEKAGEAAELVLRDLDRRAIESARMAFLDMDETPAPAPEGEALPAVQVQRFASMDHREPTESPAAVDPSASATDADASSAVDADIATAEGF